MKDEDRSMEIEKVRDDEGKRSRQPDKAQPAAPKEATPE